MGKAPFFIFGSPRSGTSLLARILDCHPEIAVAHETCLYEAFLPLCHLYGSSPELVRDMLSASEIRRLWPSDLQPTLKVPESIKFGDCVESIMNCWCRYRGKHLWGEKTPSHTRHWRTILRDFPSARVIFLVRDGRDVALSQIAMPFGPKHIYAAAKSWRHFSCLHGDIRSNIREKRRFDVHYEDLVREPHRTFHELCTFLNVEFRTEMLDYHQQPLTTYIEPTNRRGVARPPEPANIQKWLTRMSPEEHRIFLAVAGRQLREYGYQTPESLPRLAWWEAAFYEFLVHPPLKFVAKLKNRRGQKQALERGIRRTRLLIRRWCERS